MEEQHKYLTDGTVVEVAGKIGDRFVVFPVYTDRDGEVYSDDDHPIMTKEVFDEPPTAELSKTVKDLQAEIIELRGERMRAEHDLNKFKETERTAMEKYKRFKGLERLDMFLDGKITHLVEERYSGPKIVPIEEETCDSDRGDRWMSLKLLSLFGGSNGDLTWKINTYKDGSGSWTEVHPATSLAEAREIARDTVKRILDRSVKTGHPETSIVYLSREYGVELPPGYEAAARVPEIERCKSALAEHSKNVEQTKAKLEKLLGEMDQRIPDPKPTENPNSKFEQIDEDENLDIPF